MSFDQKIYFAAHAPTEIPDWFQPDLEQAVPGPDAPALPAEIQAKLDEHDEKLYLDHQGLPKLHPIVKLDDQQQKLFRGYWSAYKKWWEEVMPSVLLKREEYRAMSWRWYYADRMVEVRQNWNADLFK